MFKNEIGQVIIASLVSVATILFLRIINWAKEVYSIRRNMREQWRGPPDHWFLGHVKKHSNELIDPEEVMQWFSDNEKLFPVGWALYIGPLKASIYIHHPEVVKQVLSASARDSIKSGLYKDLIPWIGKGLLLANPPEWNPHRKLLTGAFHFDILKPYATIINQSAQTMIDKWMSKLNADDEIKVEMFHDVSLFTLDSILKCLMSFKSDCQHQDKIENPYIKAVYDLSRLMTARRMSTRLVDIFDFLYYRSANGRKFLEACQTVHRMSHFFIDRRRRRSHVTTAPRDDDVDVIKPAAYTDFLDMLLNARDENGHRIGDDVIQSQIDTFLFAGHDTTASAISWCLYCLSLHPHHQERCWEEIGGVLGDGEEGRVDSSHLSSFPHLTRCIKESVRMYPPVPFVGRKLKKDVRSMGKTIKKGSLVVVSLIGAQRHPDVWDNPDQFDPDRFTVERASQRHHHSFVPFSAGPRNCIGQNFAMNEVKIGMVKILKRFRVRLDPAHEVKRSMEMVLRAQHGLHFILTPRRK